MPITVPAIDDRRYQQLLDELLARVPVHTPEWTNFNQSDPGVTLVQLFAFLAESVLYRANQIPERNRRKFLSLLGVALKPAAAARGLVTISNERAAATAQLLPADLELRAGNIAFRTDAALEVLPVEGRAFFKRRLRNASASQLDYYRLLYASYQTAVPADLALKLYETVAFERGLIDLNDDTVDQSLWVALLARKSERPGDPADPWKALREQVGGHTLTLGVVPALDDVQARAAPGSAARQNELLLFETPRVDLDRRLPLDADGRPAPGYLSLEPRTDRNLLSTPGVVQLTLPGADNFGVWRDLDPLESGVGDMPPMLDDATLGQRLVGWVRVRATGIARARLLWAGINAMTVQQRERVLGEPLADGDGTPDQQRRLARAPVLAGSVQLRVRSGSAETDWTEIDDLLAAGPEVALRDDREAPGLPAAPPGPTEVFVLDAEAGMLQFGDGLRGRRPPPATRLFASYDFCQGAAGNLAPLAINSAPRLPSGFTVANPVRSWGGADAETAVDGERQIQRHLQHRDRLVSRADFESIAWRAPGVNVGRIDVLAAFHPDLVPNEPGAAPGVVTVMAVPRFDADQPDAPRADRLFLNALCAYLEPRRLVTTELIVRGPVYKDLWLSVGIDVGAGLSVAVVVDAVKTRLRRFLAPLPADAGQAYAANAAPLFATPLDDGQRGWPLQRAVNVSALVVEVARVAGVTAVAGVLLAEGLKRAVDAVAMTGLELPRVRGISVVADEPVAIEALRGDAAAAGAAAPAPPSMLPVPVVPESC